MQCPANRVLKLSRSVLNAGLLVSVHALCLIRDLASKVVGWQDSQGLVRHSGYFVEAVSALSLRENSTSDLQRSWQRVLVQVSYRQ